MENFDWKFKSQSQGLTEKSWANINQVNGMIHMLLKTCSEMQDSLIHITIAQDSHLKNYNNSPGQMRNGSGRK